MPPVLQYWISSSRSTHFQTVGSWVLARVYFDAGYLLASLRKPYDAPRNPWAAGHSSGRRSRLLSTHNFDFRSGSCYMVRMINRPRGSINMSDSVAVVHEDHSHRHQDESPAPFCNDNEQQMDAGKLGMWLFLATEILLVRRSFRRLRTDAGEVSGSVRFRRTTTWTRISAS